MSLPSTPIVLLASPPPTGTCYPSEYNQVFVDVANYVRGILSGTTSFIIQGATEPDPADRDKLWAKDDGFIYGFNLYGQGKWVSKYWPPAGANGFRMWWDGSEADLNTFDGGDGGIVTATGGTFWVRDTNYDGKFSLQAGTLQPSATVVAIGATGGVDQVGLTAAQNGAHFHNIQLTGFRTNLESLTAQWFAPPNGSVPVTNPATGTVSTDPDGNGDPHTNVPPYRAGFWAKRSARIWRVA